MSRVSFSDGHVTKSPSSLSLEQKACLDKAHNLNTACDFIKCFHERYQCNEESVTAWAHELCEQFPIDVVYQFTPQVGISRSLDLSLSRHATLSTGKRHDDQHPELHTRVSRSNLSATQNHQLQCLRTEVFRQHGQMLRRRERLLSSVQRESTDLHEAGNNGDAQEASVSVEFSSSSPPVCRIY